MKKIIAFILPLLLCRCSTMGGSIGLGASIGAGAGFTASKFAQYNTKGTVVLTASGALIGGLLGALFHRDPIGPMSISGLNGNPPPLKDADTDVIWVPDSIQDGKFIEGHRLWNIRSPAHWQHYPAEPDNAKHKAESKPEEKNEKSGNRTRENKNAPSH